MSTYTPQRRTTGENTLVTIMFFAAGIVFLDRFGIAYAFPFIGPDLQLNNAQLGLTISVTAIAWAISSIVFSILSDRFRWRKKPIIVISIIVFSLATGLTGLANSFVTLIAVRALIGFAEGPALPLIQSAVAAASSSHRRGRNLGIVIAGTAVIGGALPPILVGLVAASIGWRNAFFLIAVPGLIVALLVAIFMKEGSADGHAAPEGRLTWAGFRTAFSNRNVLLGLVGAITFIGFTLTTTSFVPLFLSQSQALDAGQIALLLTLVGLAGAVANVLMPSLSDRIGRKPAFLITAAAAILVPVVYIIGQNSLPLLFLVVVLNLAAAGGLTIIMYVIPGESVSPVLAATTFAVLIAVGETLGGAGGPAVGGALADQFGLSGALWFSAALAAVALIAGALTRETHPRGGARRDQHEAMEVVADELPPLDVEVTHDRSTRERGGRV